MSLSINRSGDRRRDRDHRQARGPAVVQPRGASGARDPGCDHAGDGEGLIVSRAGSGPCPSESRVNAEARKQHERERPEACESSRPRGDDQLARLRRMRQLTVVANALHGKEPFTSSRTTCCLLLCSAMLLTRLLPRDDDLPVAFVHAGMELHGGKSTRGPNPLPPPPPPPSQPPPPP